MTDVSNDVDWVKMQDKDKFNGFDERFIIRVYRFCKQHYEFWLGFFVALVIMIVIIK